MDAASRRVRKFPKDPKELHRVIGYKPRPLQAELEKHERRFNAEVMHRRFGKTVCKVVKLLDRAAFCPFENGRYAYTAPTYAMAEDIAWAYLKMYHGRLMSYLGEEDASPFQNNSKLFVTVPTKYGTTARIKLYGVDNQKERMRGMYLDGIVLDEWAMVPPSVWSEQMRPMLSDECRDGNDEFGRRNQWADFIFTPKGRNHAYTTYERAKKWYAGESVIVRDDEDEGESEIKRDDWFAAIYRASDTKYVKKNELEQAKADMGRSKYDQEFECSFDAAVEGAIFAKDIEFLKQQGQIGKVPYNTLLPVHTAWDLGHNGATAIWFFQRIGTGVAVIDYYEHSGASLPHYAKLMASKPYVYGYNLLPHDVEVTELGSGKDRATVLRELGVRVTTVTRIAHKADAIAAAQALLPKCWFSAAKCAEGLDRLSLYRRQFDQKNMVMRDKPLADWASHGADAFMTLACGLRQTQEQTFMPAYAEM